jgi:uncharacterized protein YcbX
MPSVAWLHVAPVKGLAVSAREEIELEPFGVAENRRFHLVDDGGRLMNGKTLGPLVRVRSSWDAAAAVLRLELPDGSVVAEEVELGEPLETDFYGRPVAGRLVVGPWGDALSSLAGREIRVVCPNEEGVGVDRGRGAVTLLSRPALDVLAREAGEDELDARRFRMLIGIDGCGAHEEDEWLGRDVRVGEAVVRPLGQVGRCAVTTHDPDTGIRTVDTLRALRGYRPEGTEPLPFGIYGSVVSPGRVRLGDAVEPL